MLNFDNLIGKKIRHCFVPADTMSVTFVMEDGFRRSLGLQNAGGTRIQFPSWQIPAHEGATVEAVTYGTGGAYFHIYGNEEIILGMPPGSAFVELPE